ncbi:MAG: TIGR02302 family protein [Alphaproteobacteria bacterium]|nr:TIGR02302 family protein [Alphaproteobacteria bacterium]
MTDASPERRTTTPPEEGPAAPGLIRRMWLARLAIAWERAWPALWPALTVAGVFSIVALLDLLPRLHVVLHAAALALFGLALLFALWRARAALALPAREAGRRRLEVASGFAHRPLAALEDDIAAGNADPESRALWRAHRQRIFARLAAVRVGAPRPGMPARDPRAMRLLLILALAVAVGAGGERAGHNFARAFTPGVDDLAALPGALDLWITPPAYTGLAPVLPRADMRTLSVPVGSQLIAQVSGGGAIPRLAIDGKPVPFVPVEGATMPAPASQPQARAQRLQSWRVASELAAGNRLTVEQGTRTLGAWDLTLIPDLPPKVDFVLRPHAGPRASLRLEYRATDDYGVNGVQMEIRRDAPPEKQGVGEPIDLALPMTGARAKETSAPAYFDLTAHPWAGLPVSVTLRATDVAGQTGVSETVKMVLPERIFENPVARAIVEQRKLVIGEPSLRPVVARALAAIASNPFQFGDDPVVLLALRVGALRLMKPVDDAAAGEIQALMWDTALRLEDGQLSAAERELRAIQQKLQDALANNAPDSEIEKLMAELQQAIDRYLQSLVEQALKNPDRSQPQMDRNTQRLSRQDLQKLLDQARQLSRTGAREAARDLLSRLQEMLENLRTMQAQRDNQRGQPGDQGAQEMMKGLQELMQRQQSLIDRTFRRSQQNRPGQFRPGQQGQRQQGQQGQQGQGQEPGEGEGEGDDAAEQEALRGMLSELMKQLGEMMGQVPDGMGRADRSMGDAGDQLRRGAPGRALRPQMDALDQLKQGARDAMREMMQRFGRAEGEGEGAPDDAFGDQQADQRDPLGRNTEGNGTSMSESYQRIPGVGEGQVQRSQEILDELIRRLGERTRPAAERDYLERLLRRF